MLCVIFGGSACAFNESLNGNSTHPIQCSITPSLARNSLTERLKLRTIAGEAHSSKRESEREKRTLCANTSTRRVHEDGTGSPMRFNGLFYCSYSFTSACTTRASHTNVLHSRARFFFSLRTLLSLHNLTNDFWLSQIFWRSHSPALCHTQLIYLCAYGSLISCCFSKSWFSSPHPTNKNQLHNGMFVRENLLRNGIEIPLRKNFNFYFLTSFDFPSPLPHPPANANEVDWIDALQTLQKR